MHVSPYSATSRNVLRSPPPATRIGGCGRCSAGGEFNGRANRWCTPSNGDSSPDHIRWAIRSTSSRRSKRSALAGKGMPSGSPPRCPTRRRRRVDAAPRQHVERRDRLEEHARMAVHGARHHHAEADALRLPGQEGDRRVALEHRRLPRQPRDGDLEQVVGRPQAVQPGLVSAHGELGDRRSDRLRVVGPTDWDPELHPDVLLRRPFRLTLSTYHRVDVVNLPGDHAADMTTRDALIDAAAELLAAGGPAAVTLREVGRRAGVSQRALQALRRQGGAARRRRRPRPGPAGGHDPAGGPQPHTRRRPAGDAPRLRPPRCS